MSRLLAVLLLTSLLAGCAGATPGATSVPFAARGASRAGAKATPASPSCPFSAGPNTSVAAARQHGAAQLFEWTRLDAETFARAAREHKFVLLHGAAAWCHWCHVMEAVTYRDPEVGAILRDRYIAVRVDVDERPDIEERYGAWGWPATIVFSPDGAEVGKFRGFVPPTELLSALREPTAHADGADRSGTEPGAESASVESFPWVVNRTTRDLDSYYDDQEGGWGMRQKAPIGENLAFEVNRARLGVDGSSRRILFTIEKQRQVMDPVWGGLYQYSTGGTWASPHYEKLMTVQAANLEAYAAAFALTRDEGARRDGSAVVSYVARFLTSPEGTFYVNQDADVGAHDEQARFTEGHDYYSRGESGRRALGEPWIDRHVYAQENGLAIAALAAFGGATEETAVTDRAKRAADAVLSTHVGPDGSVKHEADTERSVRFLADAAGFGYGLARLALVTGEPRYRAAAQRIAERLTAFADPTTDALYEHTADEAAAGVFAVRRHPFRHNVLAARFLATLSDLTGDESHRARGRRILAAVATPGAIDAEGRHLGGFLLAAAETAPRAPSIR